MDKTSLSVQEVAEVLGISKNTVYELIRRNELASYRIGRKVRVDLQDIENYKNKSRTGTKPEREKENVLVGSYRIPPAVTESRAQDLSTYQQPFQAQALSMDDNLIICGQDMVLDILTRYLVRKPYNIQALRSYVGSYNGLIELYKGNASIASAHLWDSETDTYNLTYLRSLLPGFSCIVVNLTYRMQGFFVAKGNPKNIVSWEDLERPDVTMINRELGCGVRILIDEHLKKGNIPKSRVNGYQNTDFSHLSVASRVARGDADVAVGNEKTAKQVDGIDFVPLQKERLDLIIPKERIFEPSLQAVIEILNSKSFQEELLGIGGYDIADTGKIIAEI